MGRKHLLEDRGQVHDESPEVMREAGLSIILLSWQSEPGAAGLLL